MSTVGPEAAPSLDIWAPLPNGASNSLKAEVFALRAEAVIASQLRRTDSALFAGGKVSRKGLAEAIGCKIAATNQNPRIRALIKKTDEHLKAAYVSPAVNELHRAISRLRFDDENVHPLHPNSKASHIVITSEELVLYDKSYAGIPAIVFADGIHDESADWLRHIRIGRDFGERTAEQYAKMLRAFLQEMVRGPRLQLSQITDAHILSWRNSKYGNMSSKKQNANNIVQIIFEFFLHCERTGRLKYRVGCYERSELPEAMKGVHFPISAIPLHSKGRRFRWASPLAFKRVPTSIGNRGTPDDEAMREAHRLLRGTRHERRTSAMLVLVEDSGARVSELLQLKLRDIPEEEELLAALETDGGLWEVKVVRKGGDEAELQFSTDALLEARSYLRFRKALIEVHRARAKKKNIHYSAPEELFISEGTGKVLTSDTVTRIVSTLLNKAGIKKAGIQRVRAKFAIDTIDEVLNEYLALGISLDGESAWVETVIQQAAARMGHRGTGSLKHYLHSALDRRLRLARRHDSLAGGGNTQAAQMQVVLKTLDAELRNEAERVQW